MFDNSVLSLIIVAIIGYCVISKDNTSKMLTWGDIGKILLIFAIVEGLMYVVAPVPMRLVCTKPLQAMGGSIFGGSIGDGYQDGGVHNFTPYVAGEDRIQTITGGSIRAGSVLDSVA